MPKRIKPAVRIDIFEVGEGDAIVLDHGFGMYDIPEKSWHKASYGYTASGLSKLEIIPGLGGLSNRPFIIPKDTRLTHFDFSATLSGSSVTPPFDEVKPLSGLYRVWRIRQYSAEAGLVWRADYKFTIPENADCAVEIIPEDTSAEWDSINFRPYYRIEFGNGAMALVIQKGTGAFLLGKVGASWQELMRMPEPGRGSGLADNDSIWVMFSYVEGQIGISFDLGNSFHWYRDPAGNYLTVPTGKWSIEGQGGIAAIGFHEVVYYYDRYFSPAVDAGRSRTLPVGSFNGSIFSELYGSDVTATAYNPLPASTTAQYYLDFTPGNRGGFPNTFWSRPVVYATQMRYPRVRQVGTDAIEEPLSTDLTKLLIEAEIVKPFTLHEGTATLYFNWKSKVLFDLDTVPWRNRKVRIKLGYKFDNGTYEWFTAFTGYVTNLSLDWGEDEYGRTEVKMDLYNATLHLKKPRWSFYDRYAYQGYTATAAGDDILKSEGLMDEAGVDTTRRAWSNLNQSSTRPMSIGKYDDPFELIKADESKFDTLQRIFSYYGLEVAANDDGVFFDLPYDYFAAVSSHDLRATAENMTENREGILRARSEMDFGESFTAVLIGGEDPWGNSVFGKVVDDIAELDKTSVRFNPWRETQMETMQGTVLPAMVQNRALYLSGESLVLKRKADLQFPVHLGLSRRARVTAHGLEGVGVPTGSELGILLLTHRFNRRGTLVSMRTIAGLRRLT